MAFPHPQSRKDHDGKEDKARWESVVGQFFKRTIDVAEYRNAEDEVNAANDGALSGVFHGRFVLH